MRGHPLWRLVFVTVGIALTGIPVWNLTHTQPPAPPPHPQKDPGSLRQGTARAESSIPVRLHILSDGESVFSGEIGQEEIGFPVSFPTGGADLLVKAEAPGTEGRFAVRLSLEEDGDVLAETTFWGNSPLNGVLTIPSKEEAR